MIHYKVANATRTKTAMYIIMFRKESTNFTPCCMTNDKKGTFTAYCRTVSSHLDITHLDRNYIQLPNNISELNDHMHVCMDKWIEKVEFAVSVLMGFAPSVISIGYECSTCTASFWSLFQLSSFVPIIIFYFAILVFQISVTSAPMTCCMMYSQLAVILVLYTTLSYIFLLGHSNKNNSFWSPARISQKGPRHTIIIAFCLNTSV